MKHLKVQDFSKLLQISPALVLLECGQPSNATLPIYHRNSYVNTGRFNDNDSKTNLVRLFAISSNNVLCPTLLLWRHAHPSSRNNSASTIQLLILFRLCGLIISRQVGHFVITYDHKFRWNSLCVDIIPWLVSVSPSRSYARALATDHYTCVCQTSIHTHIDPKF